MKYSALFFFAFCIGCGHKSPPNLYSKAFLDSLRVSYTADSIEMRNMEAMLPDSTKARLVREHDGHNFIYSIGGTNQYFYLCFRKAGDSMQIYSDDLSRPIVYYQGRTDGHLALTGNPGWFTHNGDIIMLSPVAYQHRINGGLILFHDSIWRMVVSVSSEGVGDSLYSLEKTHLPVQYKDAAEYGPILTDGETLRKWALANRQTSFIVMEDNDSSSQICYRHIEKGECFYIVNTKTKSNLFWQPDNDQEEGWVAIFCDQGSWQNGNLFINENAPLKWTLIEKQ